MIGEIILGLLIIIAACVLVQPGLAMPVFSAILFWLSIIGWIIGIGLIVLAVLCVIGFIAWLKE